MKIEELMTNVTVSDTEQQLTDYDDGYLCDIISEIAGGWTSINYCDIIKFISEHVEEVNDTIEEFGWDGCGSDLYKAGQMAECMLIEREFDIKDALRNRIFEYLKNNNIVEVSDDQFSEIEYLIEKSDTNDRLDSILDEVDSIVEIEED